jgi:cell division protein FtsB
MGEIFMRWTVLLVALALAACGPSKDAVDVADVNARNALDQISSLRSRVDQLESENEQLKMRLDYIEAEIS